MKWSLIMRLVLEVQLLNNLTKKTNPDIKTTPKILTIKPISQSNKDWRFFRILIKFENWCDFHITLNYRN